MNDAIAIAVYGKPVCRQCIATTRKLDTLGLAYTYTDITEDPGAYDYVIGLGYKEAPVVVLSTGESWSGYRPEKLRYITEGA